ncbi:putative bifunctional diguanylate cyclase/phosphodiesterase [Glaciibacter sp. 2TAF33]|uniref:putative bifunctional diguanylate cyclase/phosphodiesterase n=1 Tax=Glaciibacter sp. 2TAF33 TaxID=3233015 RepID=UPI003F9070F8
MRAHVAEHPAEIESSDPEPDRLRFLELAAKDLTAGGSLHDVLDRIIVGAADAVPALCHDLAIELPDGSKYSRWRCDCEGRCDCEAGAEALIQLRGDDPEKESGGKVLAVPVASDTHTYGTLIALAPEDAYFSSEDRTMLAAYGHHAAAGIEMTNLLAELGEEQETAEVLLEAARSLSEQYTVDDVAQSMSEAALMLSGANRSGVALWDSDTAQLRFHGATGWQGALAQKLSDFVLTTQESPELHDMLINPTPLLIDRRGSNWATSMLDHFELKALLAIPILTNEDFRGLVIAHWDGDAPHSLDHAAVQRLSGLAGLASVALHNAQLMEDARWKSLRDPLTGLANRTLFEEQLQAALGKAAVTGHSVGVLLCDINRFKRFNESLGHGAGDEVLRQVATRLGHCVDDGDIVARINGDQFAVLTIGADAVDRSATIAAKIRQTFREPLSVGSEKLFADLAIGIATSTGPSIEEAGAFGKPAQRMIELADLDLHRSKATITGHIHTDHADAEWLRLETDLRGAAGRGELRVHYQPQIDLANGSIVGVEALVRWEHPELGMISPASFIPIAEASGLIREVGFHVLQEATQTGAKWHAAGFPIEMAVNVSVAQLSAPSFLSQLKEALHQTGFPAASLTIEITESQVVTDHAVLRTVLRELRELGAGLSIDDFGTGFSSLTQLQRMPVTEIKIDRAFTTEQTGSAVSPFVAGIVGLGHGLSLRVIAEGVETEEQLAAVRAAGCDRAQGYLLGRPGDAAATLRHIKQKA